MLNSLYSRVIFVDFLITTTTSYWSNLILNISLNCIAYVRELRIKIKINVIINLINAILIIINLMFSVAIE